MQDQRMGNLVKQNVILETSNEFLKSTELPESGLFLPRAVNSLYLQFCISQKFDVVLDIVLFQ